MWFLSSGVTRACLNVVGKFLFVEMLMLCVSAGKCVGEIACRRM